MEYKILHIYEQPGCKKLYQASCNLSSWDKFQWNWNQNTNISFQENSFQYVCEMWAILFSFQCVK